MTFTTYIEFECEIEADYSRACPGSREHGTGLKLEPDEPESVEITKVTVLGVEIPLDALAKWSPKMIEKLEEEALAEATEDPREYERED